MITTILTKTSIAMIVLILMIPIIGRRILSYKIFIAMFFIVYFADNFLIILANQVHSIQIIPNHIWEGFLICSWSGKLFSIIFMLLVIYVTRRMISINDIGLSFPQREGFLLPSIIILLGLAGWATIIGFFSTKGSFDAQTLAYLAIMPGINEELVYRGYLLGIWDKLSPPKISLLGARIGWGALVTSILFALLHGYSLDNSLTVHLDLIALRNSFISGFIFAWLRERTGSLVMPVIAHGLEDFLFFLPRMI